jgi:heterodisulfide reductase subunit B
MFTVSYMPGCTLKTSGKNFEESTLKLLERLDVKVEELQSWYCCGTTYSLASDNIMNHLAPIRTLIRAKETGRRELLVLCSMCYNTLRRAQDLVLNDEEKRNKINDFMYREETELSGHEVRVVHLLNFLKEFVGFERLAEKVTRRARDLTVALYYGCMLLRPDEISVDASSENPAIMEELFTACGVETAYFPFKTECCGSYQTVNRRSIVLERVKEIVESAVKNAANLIVTSCPLCFFNLDDSQKILLDDTPDFTSIPILYISQVLALLMGIEDATDYSLHAIDPRPVLKEKGLLR